MFAFTVPFREAVLEDTEEAAMVTTAGGVKALPAYAPETFRLKAEVVPPFAMEQVTHKQNARMVNM